MKEIIKTSYGWSCAITIFKFFPPNYQVLDQLERIHSPNYHYYDRVKFGFKKKCDFKIFNRIFFFEK